MSPTSILDSTNKNPFSAFRNPFWSETNSPRTPSGGEPKHRWDSKGVGLGGLVVDDDDGGNVGVVFCVIDNRVIDFDAGVLGLSSPAMARDAGGFVVGVPPEEDDDVINTRIRCSYENFLFGLIVEEDEGAPKVEDCSSSFFSKI